MKLLVESSSIYLDSLCAICAMMHSYLEEKQGSEHKWRNAEKCSIAAVLLWIDDGNAECPTSSAKCMLRQKLLTADVVSNSLLASFHPNHSLPKPAEMKSNFLVDSSPSRKWATVFPLISSLACTYSHSGSSVLGWRTRFYFTFTIARHELSGRKYNAISFFPISLSSLFFC